MADRPLAARLRRLPEAEACGVVVPVALGFWPRLLGLSFLDVNAVGAGLLIPACRSVHTFGMRFPLDIVFLNEAGEVLSIRPALAPRHVASCRAAAAVLELPARKGGDFPVPRA